MGYAVGNEGMITGGWGLIAFGGGIYVLELILYYYSE